MSTYEELLELREALTPYTEFMCHLAEDHALYQAREAMNKKIQSYNAETSCLINIYCDTLLAGNYHIRNSDPGYQEFRKQWLDALIEEYAV